MSGTLRGFVRIRWSWTAPASGMFHRAQSYHRAKVIPLITAHKVVEPVAANIEVATEAPSFGGLKIVPLTATVAVAAEAPNLGKTVAPAAAAVTIETEAPSTTQETPHQRVPIAAAIQVQTEAPVVSEDIQLAPSALKMVRRTIRYQGPSSGMFYRAGIWQRSFIIPLTVPASGKAVPIFPGRLRVATEAPTVILSGALKTVTPSAEATILAIGPNSRVVSSTPQSLSHRFARLHRRFVFYGEGYARPQMYTRSWTVPIFGRGLPQPTSAEITVETDAPTIVATDELFRTAHPTAGLITTKTQAPVVVRTTPGTTIIYAPFRRPVALPRGWHRTYGLGSPYGYHVVYRTRAIALVEGAGSGVNVTPAGSATIAVSVAAPVAATPEIRSVLVTGPATILVQNSNHDPHVTTPSTEIAVTTISGKRRRRRAAQIAFRARSYWAAPKSLHYVFATVATVPHGRPGTATLTVEAGAPTVSVVAPRTARPGVAAVALLTGTTVVSSQGETQPVHASIVVSTEAPNIDKSSVITPTVATISVVDLAPGLSGIETVAFPGGDGEETVEIAIIGGTPNVKRTRWDREPVASDGWVKESAASDGWVKVDSATGSWRK